MRTNLAVIAAQQYGAFTWAQALAEYSPKEIRTRVRGGEWCRVFRGVYREAIVPASPQLRTAAAALLLGRGAVACRDTAAQLHGVDILGDTVTHMLAPRRYGSRFAGMVVHQETFTDSDVVRRYRLQTTNTARTVIDLARTYSRMDALALLDSALRGEVRYDALVEELTRHAGRRGFRQATELLGYATPKAESPMESRTRMRCIDAGLPVPDVQVYVPIPFGTERWLDLGWKDLRIGLDYDSIDFHSGAVAASRDTPRHNWLTREGWTMFYATPQMVYRSPHDFTGPIGARIAELSGMCHQGVAEPNVVAPPRRA